MENTRSLDPIVTYDDELVTVMARPLGPGQLAPEVVVYGPTETLRMDPASARALAAALLGGADTAEVVAR